MKIRQSTLRQIIREEISRIINEGPEEDNASYEKIMAMITSALGDSPETKKMGSQLQGAFQTKKQDQVPGTMQMKSVARPPTAPPTPQSPNDITMNSIAQKPGTGY